MNSCENPIVLTDGEVRFRLDTDAVPGWCDGWMTLSAAGTLPVPDTLPGDRLILPIDEGIALPVEANVDPGEFALDTLTRARNCREKTLNLFLLARGGKCLAITTDSGLHTGYALRWADGRYRLTLTSDAPVTVRYRIFPSAAAACRAYRAMRPAAVPLRDKIARTPALAQLIGGAIFWVWNDGYDEVMYADRDTDRVPDTGGAMLDVAADLHANGVDRAMFGLFFDGDSRLAQPLAERFGYLATQYDNYNDVLNPALVGVVPTNRVRNCGYTARRMKDYPAGIARSRSGELASAWALKGFDGQFHAQNALCPAVAAQRMREEIPPILAQYPAYRGRFIDVYGTGVGECFDPHHPLTVDDCLTVKRGAFASLRDMGLIVGTEDGFEDLIDNLDYAEGLHSPVVFRNRDSGRNHAHVYTDAQEAHIARYMLHPAYRFPMLELAYHDCILAFPYWGDSTEMSPAQIRRKTLFACLYGCPPLYSFTVGDYPRLRCAILDSYRTISAVHRAVGLMEMTDFAVLTPDFAVQRTVFGGEIEVIVNFGGRAYEADGRRLEPLGLHWGTVQK